MLNWMAMAQRLGDIDADEVEAIQLKPELSNMCILESNASEGAGVI